MNVALNTPPSAVRAAIDAAIARGDEIGVQIAVYVGGELVLDVSAGWTDRPGGTPVTGETLFPVFSVTKGVTVTALHIQAERGLVDYEAPIARYWPEFAVEGKGALTVAQALTHQLGMPQMPQGVTPESMCDWDGMVAAIAAQKPALPPGTSAYMPFSFGWILGEIVRRTDPKHRPFGDFVQQEICQPLRIEDLWIGIPDRVEPRIASLTNEHPSLLAAHSEDLVSRLRAAASPPAVATYRADEVWGRPDVRRACIGGANGIMTAASGARFWAMLANGGTLDGVRLLSETRVRSFTRPRPNVEEPDMVLGRPVHVGVGGYYLGGPAPPATPAIGRNRNTIAMPGSGGSIGWADLDRKLAVMICHNKMHDNRRPHDPEANPFIGIADAIREWVG